MPQPPVPDTSSRVLIADDERNMRRTLANILRREGYNVVTVTSGEEAVERCRSESFSIILMDVRLPGIDGVEAFRRIRRHREGVRVILMSAYGIEDLRESALEEGAIAFLPKPLDVERVVDLIKDVKDTTILVVEDDPQTIKVLDTELSANGYKIVATSSPHDALELVEQIRFDLIFIDAKLPSMSGLDLYLAIKKINPIAVTIMIAGMGEEFERLAREAVRQTAYTFVRKPLDVDHILGLLQRITGQQISGAVKKPQSDSS